MKRLTVILGLVFLAACGNGGGGGGGNTSPLWVGTWSLISINSMPIANSDVASVVMTLDTDSFAQVITWPDGLYCVMGGAIEYSGNMVTMTYTHNDRCDVQVGESFTGRIIVREDNRAITMSLDNQTTEVYLRIS